MFGGGASDFIYHALIVTFAGIGQPCNFAIGELVDGGARVAVGSELINFHMELSCCRR